MGGENLFLPRQVLVAYGASVYVAIELLESMILVVASFTSSS